MNLKWDARDVRKVGGIGAGDGPLTRQLRIGFRHKGDRHVPTLLLCDDLEALGVIAETIIDSTRMAASWERECGMSVLEKEVREWHQS